jgi:hypothetical protein
MHTQAAAAATKLEEKCRAGLPWCLITSGPISCKLAWETEIKKEGNGGRRRIKGDRENGGEGGGCLSLRQTGEKEKRRMRATSFVCRHQAYLGSVVRSHLSANQHHAPVAWKGGERTVKGVKSFRTDL